MKVVISRGNSKIGGVPNVSLTPGESCRKDVPCFTDGCYAKQSFLRYPNVRTAWGNNLKFAREDLLGFMDQISEYCWAMEGNLFRWHVAGDVLNQSYADEMILIAKLHSWISFLCFTKRYDLNFSHRPKNLHVVLSTWPALTLPKNKELPFAWLEGDVRIPKDQYYFRCPGNCEACEHICWDKLDKDVHVVFPKH